MSALTLETVHDCIAGCAAAEQANDPDRLSRYLCADFLGVGPAGFTLTRAAWLARFAGGLHYDTVTVTEQEVRLHDEAAIAVGILDQTGTHAGRDISTRVRITLTVLSGGPRIAALHLGPFTPGAEQTQAGS